MIAPAMAEPTPPAPPPAPLVPRYLPAGDAALTVELGQAISPAISEAVARLDTAIGAAAIPGVVETVPTYRSLMVHFDPLVIAPNALIERLKALAVDDAAGAAPARRLIVPVRYGDEAGMDLEEVAKRHQITTDEVIRLHSSGDYRVYMIGFSPGFTYLGGLPEPIHTPRRENPRLRTPARAISIGGVQAAVGALAIPSGWHMLGQTPLRGFDPRRAEPFLFQVGDHVRFVPVARPEFERLDKLGEAGTLVPELDA
jgi:KipI family sensor histidine kinase inhibitor